MTTTPTPQELLRMARDWQAIATREAAEHLGTPEGAARLVEAKRYGLLADALAAPPSPVARVPLTPSQRRRLWNNSPEHHADAKSITGFERIVTLTERAHGIGIATKADGDGEAE